MAKDKKIQETVEEFNESVIDLKLDEIIPNVIDNYIVGIFDDHHTIVLPMNTTGIQFRSWNKGKGGIFSKDVLNYSFGKNHGKYVLIKSSNLTCIARIITEEEELHFNTMKLIDGKIKDSPYMILKKIQSGEKLSGTQSYVNEKGVQYEEIEHAPIPVTKINSKDDDHHPLKSISLFTE